MASNSLISNPWWRSKGLRTYGPAVAGFLVYGLWACFANSDHGTPVAVRSGLVQGSYSFVLTLTTTVLMQRLYQRWAGLPGRGVWVTLTVCTGLFATAYGINWLAGTPEILMTILPGFFIGCLFTATYIKGLSKLV